MTIATMTVAKKKHLRPDSTGILAEPTKPKEGRNSAQWRERRCGELRAFQIALAQDNVAEYVAADEELFATIVDLSTTEYGVEQRKIAEHLAVSPTAVTRWKSREHAPRPYARQAVIQAISALVEAKLNELMAELTDLGDQTMSKPKRIVSKPPVLVP